jgi:hypothetical protein
MDLNQNALRLRNSPTRLLAWVTHKQVRADEESVRIAQ